MRTVIRSLIAAWTVCLSTWCVASDSPFVLMDRAIGGDNEAAYRLGRAHLDGPSGDVATGRYWLEKAAHWGSQDAARDLAALALADLGHEASATRKESLRTLNRMAERGDAEADYLLGRWHERGNGWEAPEYWRVRSHYGRAAKLGHAGAAFRLGELMLEGTLAAPDGLDEAIALWEFAAERGSADAAWELAQSYRNGRVVNRNLNLAMDWTIEAAKSGSQRAAEHLLKDYKNGGFAADRHAPLMEWLRGADANSQPARLEILAVAYQRGEGVTRSAERAHQIRSFVAERRLGGEIFESGDPSAAASGGGFVALLDRLDQMDQQVASLTQEVGALKDTTEQQTERWAGLAQEVREAAVASVEQLLSAELGSLRQDLLAHSEVMRAESRSVMDEIRVQRERMQALEGQIGAVVDRYAAAESARTARALAARERQETMGRRLNENGLRAYENGEYLAAVGFWLKGAGYDNADSQNNLGFMFLRGLGTEQDQGEALRWYRFAAENGSAQGQYMLAKCFLNGWGTAVDEAAALDWLRQSAEQGYTRASELLADMERPSDALSLGDS